MQPTSNRTTQLNILLNIYVSQYDEMMRQINLSRIEVSRIRHMIDNISNDIRNEPPRVQTWFNPPVGHTWFQATSDSGHTQIPASSSILDASFNVLNHSFSDVVIVPTEQQITNATVTRPFGNLFNTINDVCPISLKPFLLTDEAMRVNYCGHVFGAPELTEWFRHNVRCPVCRHDIRGEDEDIYADLPELQPI